MCEENENKVLPWFKRGHKMFRGCVNYHQFGHFGWGNLNTQLYGYIGGYMESAHALVDIALDSEKINILDT